MDAPAHVLSRLERIEALDRAAVPAAHLLDELRALVSEAEAWARRREAGGPPPAAAPLPGEVKE
jgi:hypothetical protein